MIALKRKGLFCLEKGHLEEAKFWLMEAKHLLRLPEESPNKFTVVCAMAIHSMIKANDALTLKFLGKTAKKHGEASVLFLELIKKGVIEQAYVGMRKTWK